MTMIQLDHIAIGMPRLADAPAALVGELGGEPYGGGASAAFSFGQWVFANGGRIEILEPRGRDGFLHRFLARHGAGIHHVTFRVADLRATCDRAADLGYTIVGFDDSDPTWKEAFLHPKDALGIVVQLAEGGEDNDAILRRWTPPPGPPDPPPAVALAGLRMRASSRERVTRQWVTLLGGQATDGARGEVIVRWPASPIRIAVDIDPVADEGPVAIEIATDRPLAFPDTPHATLGVVLRVVSITDPAVDGRR